MFKSHTKHIIVLDLDHLKQGKETDNGDFPEDKFDAVSKSCLYVRNSWSAKHETDGFSPKLISCLI